MLATEVIEASPSNQLTVIAKSKGIAPALATQIVTTFAPMVMRAKAIADAAAKVKVTDATMLTEMKQARQLRIDAKNLRGEAEKARVSIKEEFLRPGQTVDEVAKFVKGLIEPVEEALREQEEFALRAEAARKEALKAKRIELLKPYGADPNFYQLTDMPEEDFQALLAVAKLAYESKIEAARKAKEEQAVLEEAQCEERDRLAAENAKMRKAQEEFAAKAKEQADRMRKERETAEDAARKEREAREALEAKVAAKVAAEEKVKAREAAAKAKAERQAALAPDKDKIKSIAALLRALALPECSSRDGKAAMENVRRWLGELADEIDGHADEIDAG